MFAPGNEVKSFVAEGLDEIPSKMWFWEDTVEYIGSENEIKRATPTLTCSRLGHNIIITLYKLHNLKLHSLDYLRYIEYDGPTVFQLDRNAREELNFTVHNGAGYETALGTLS